MGFFGEGLTFKLQHRLFTFVLVPLPYSFPKLRFVPFTFLFFLFSFNATNRLPLVCSLGRLLFYFSFLTRKRPDANERKKEKTQKSMRSSIGCPKTKRKGGDGNVGDAVVSYYPFVVSDVIRYPWSVVRGPISDIRYSLIVNRDRSKKEKQRETRRVMREGEGEGEVRVGWGW